MNLKEKIQTDIKECMKNKDKKRISVLRMLLSEMQYAETASDRSAPIDNAQMLKVIASYEKRLTKSLADFPDGDKKEEIRYEISIVSGYLPKKATEKEFSASIDKILSQSDERNFGVIMKQVMSQFGSAADGNTISKILKQKLAE
ncbi:MAG: GatB/YqeY domain-containing protein [Bdellovibrionota bacterium]